METKQGRRVSLPDGGRHNPLMLALAVYGERIRGLPPDDQQELFQLAKELIRAETFEEGANIYAAMEEILDQAPVRLTAMDLTTESPPGPGLQKWIDFVSEKIKSQRKHAGLTQEELAEKSGLPQSHISRLENGQHSPSRVTLEKIAIALGIEVKVFDPMAD